jgi:hypothetical protein
LAKGGWGILQAVFRCSNATDHDDWTMIIRPKRRDQALREIERVGRKHRYIVVESYRNEEEKANLLYRQLTCESFCTPEEWQ